MTRCPSDLELERLLRNPAGLEAHLSFCPRCATRAAEAGLSVWALTDHDSVGALDEGAAMAQRLGLRFVAGVERELQHAFEGGKEVYVVWACRAMPSPFITQTATRVFSNVKEALEYFTQKGYIKTP